MAHGRSHVEQVWFLRVGESRGPSAPGNGVWERKKSLGVGRRTLRAGEMRSAGKATGGSLLGDFVRGLRFLSHGKKCSVL